MLWEIIKTSILSFLVIYLVHNIYCAFFERRRGIPGYTKPSKVRFKEPVADSQPSATHDTEPVDKDLKSELMDFMTSSEEKEEEDSGAIGVTKLGDLPNEESRNSD